MKNIKKLTVLFLIFTLVLSFVACSNEKDISKIDEIKEKGKIVIGTSAAYPPYEFHKEINGKDEIIGFDIEIAKVIADELGVELEIKDMDFGGLLGALMSNKIDIVIAGMNPTEERKKNVDFSKVYYIAKQSVVINKENFDKIKTTEDLKGKTIAVQKGSTQEGMAKDIAEEKDIKALGKISNLIMELLNNKVDAVIVEEPVAKSYIQKNPSLCLSTVELQTGDSGSAIAINKGNDDLVKLINSVLDKLIEENKIEKFVIDSTQLVEE